MEKVKFIKDRLKTTQIRQKYYADVSRRELEFQVDDWVFHKVSPIKRGYEIWNEREAQSSICRPLQNVGMYLQGGI